MLYLGLLFGVIAGNVAAHRTAINPLRVYIATLILIIPALSGARLLFVAAHWNIYRHNLRRIWDRREGGLTMYGGLPCVLLMSIPVLWVLRLDFGTFWDVASFTILTGMIFARIGCLLNGCCYGRCLQASFAFLLPDAKGKWDRRAPTQVLEALTGAMLLVLAALSWRWMPFPGALFLIVILGYSAARFAMEYLREPEPRRGRIALAQLTSALLFVSCLCLFTLHWRK